MMTSRNALLSLISATLLAGGLLMADQTSAAPHRRAEANYFDRMSSTLNLTDQQKQQAKTIFMNEREAARAVRQELFAERKAVQSAIQTGKPPAEVQQLAKNEGPALGQLAGMRAQAFARFYAELTPAQQQKLAGLHQEWRQRHAAGPNPGSR
jgi:Spy/CpxP family protein refolding chaperone